MSRISLSVSLFVLFHYQSFCQSSEKPGLYESGINFENGMNWEQACEKARAERKYIFVDVFATWCGPCKSMDREVYSSQLLGEKMKNKFVAIKIQADSSRLDDEMTRKRYGSARDFVRKNRITGYPTLLFFSPEGRLLEEELGYRNVNEFVSMIDRTLDPGTAALYGKLDAYRSGVKDYANMGRLALFVKQIIRNSNLADSIAIDYKVHFLDKLSKSQICNREYFEFLDQFPLCVTSSDAFFDLCYNQAELVDSIEGRKGWAKYQVERTVIRERLVTPFVLNGRPIVKKPKWKDVEHNIKGEYPKIAAELLVLQFQIKYYRSIDQDWKTWCKYMERKLEADPPDSSGLASNWPVFVQLNLPAWDVFEHCDNRKVLKVALKWSELSIRLNSLNPDVQCLDTRANLLYKLGRKSEAMAQENAAIEMCLENAKRKKLAKAPFLDEYLANREKMSHELPTWPTN